MTSIPSSPLLRGEEPLDAPPSALGAVGAGRRRWLAASPVAPVLAGPDLPTSGATVRVRQRRRPRPVPRTGRRAALRAPLSPATTAILADATALAAVLLAVPATGAVVAVLLVVAWRLLVEATGGRAGAAPAVGASVRAAAALLGSAAVADRVLPLPGDVVLAAGLVALVAGTVRCGLVLALTARPVRVLVAGHRGAVHRTLAELAGSRLDVVAVCMAGPRGLAPPEPGNSSPGIAAAAGFSSIPRLAREHDVDLVVVLPCHHLPAAVLRRLSWQLAETGAQLLTGPGLSDVTVSRLVGRQVGPLSFTQVHHPSMRGTSRAVKVVVERVLAAVLLVLVAPALGLLAVLVRLDSPGPAVFRQVRIGRGGEPFTMLKLRTMGVAPMSLADAVNDADGCLFKLRQDPRVTRVGAWLRRLSLDELPQLVNVVRGEMALVGPRPPLPEEVERYDDDARRRLVVTPGLTGLWQVSGRSDLSWADTVRLDVRYVDNWSLGLDVRILALTVRAVLGRRGAY